MLAWTSGLEMTGKLLALYAVHVVNRNNVIMTLLQSHPGTFLALLPSKARWPKNSHGWQSRSILSAGEEIIHRGQNVVTSSREYTEERDHTPSLLIVPQSLATVWTDPMNDECLVPGRSGETPNHHLVTRRHKPGD